MYMKNLKFNITSTVIVLTFILTSFFVFFVYQNPHTYVTRLPVIILMFIVTMIIVPFKIFQIIKEKNLYEKTEMIIRIVSKILISITCNFLIVLLFTKKGYTLGVGSMISIFNCLFLFFIFFKNSTFKLRNVLFDHWIITSVFIGLLIFLK